MKLRLTTLTVAVALLMVGFAPKASALTILTIGDPLNYLGKIVDGIPSAEANEVAWINLLNDLGINALPVIGNCDATPPASALDTCDRVGSTLVVPGGFDDAVEANSMRNEDTGVVSIALGGMTYQYVLGKYANSGSLVWYSDAGFTGVITPPAFSGGGLSHISVYNKGGTTVPDGGSTAALLGSVFLGFGILRRRFRKN